MDVKIETTQIEALKMYIEYKEHHHPYPLMDKWLLLRFKPALFSPLLPKIQMFCFCPGAILAWLALKIAFESIFYVGVLVHLIKSFKWLSIIAFKSGLFSINCVMQRNQYIVGEIFLLFSSRNFKTTSHNKINIFATSCNCKLFFQFSLTNTDEHWYFDADSNNNSLFV